ncbi:hypothetical protein GHT06_011837 [Daphnia sinensis]|uniref:PID domain-containing protein n=1 Tax=Daphnia sinensis TaxID=1820382 RepID=A0AAD5LN52_9CRUS|nr:hypothetical protein GHT06_011837 [Daphnia sinensis]
MEKLSAKMKKTSLMPRWWKKRFTAVITESDPSFKVVYLGNVLTGWAKGEGCLDKPLATLWKNYCQSSRPDVSMRLSVCSSGLQATTSEHGLTEYWSHRVTWCSAPPSYPRIFAWVYRHEGRRLKQELRCHAVLCTTGRQARQLTARLEQRLREALHDFRREKLCRQSARLSVAACLYEDYASAIPKRKLLLAPGINNYKPPVERCKSAPKLGSIEESPELEEVEEKDWLRVLALRGSAQPLQRNNTVIKPVSPVRSSLETVREEDRCLSTPSLPCKIITECDPSPDAVSPDGLLDLAEVKVTLMPDGGTSCVDGSPAAVQSECPMVKPMRLPLLRRMSAEARKKFGSADCVIDNSGRPSSPPPILPRRARRSLPCRAASVNDYAAELQLQQNRALIRRQSQPEYVGVARRPTSEYIESRDEYLYDEEEIDFRLRLDSAVEELLESDSFSGSSPCSSADHSPNLADKGRLNLVASPCDQVQAFHLLASEDHDNVSDESGYSDDKDVISSSSSVSEAGTVKTAKGAYTMAEEFTLNL